MACFDLASGLIWPVPKKGGRPAASSKETSSLRPRRLSPSPPCVSGEPLRFRFLAVRRQRFHTRDAPAESPARSGGVTRFQHRRKISSILKRNTVLPFAIRTTAESCLAIEGVKSPKTRSCYEYHPAGRSKTVRTAVGRSIFPADGTGRSSKPAAGEGEPADRRARQEQKKNPPG